MKRRLSLYRISKWLILPPLLIGLGCLAFFISRRRELPRREIAERSLVVQVERVVPSTIRAEAIGFGTAKPSRTWRAVAEVQGRIVDLHPRLESGYLIEQGLALATIDDADYQYRLEQREADLDAALARVEELKASQEADGKSLAIEQDLLEVNQKDVERFLTLRGNQAIAESEYENAKQALLRQTQAVQQLKKALKLYPPQISSAEASVALARARVEEARRDVERTVIKSPMSGRLSGVSLEIGQFVRAGEELFEVQDASRVEVDSQFSLAQLSRLLPAPQRGYQRLEWESSDVLDDFAAEVLVRSGELEIRWAGKPLRFSDQVDEQTRTRGIVIQVHNPSLRAIGPMPQAAVPQAAKPELEPSAALLPGTFCEVALSGPALQQAITVPRTALDGATLYVVEQENGQSRLKMRNVTTGTSIGRRVLIQNGLTAGDLVLVRAPAIGIEGQLVEPVVVDGGDTMASVKSIVKQQARGSSTRADEEPSLP